MQKVWYYFLIFSDVIKYLVIYMRVNCQQTPETILPFTLNKKKVVTIYSILHLQLLLISCCLGSSIICHSLL